MAIRTVALAGGTGNLGLSIVKALLRAGFKLTVLTRALGKPVDSRAKIQPVNYGSINELTAALRGFDAVVNALAIGTVPQTIHVRLAVAAQRAGVSRYIPSEFGSNTAHPLTSQIPVFSDKLGVVKVLRWLSTVDPTFTWSALITGPFFDWGLDFRFLVNLRDFGTDVYDGGDVPFSTTTLDGAGKAVVGVLTHLEETKNRYVYIAEADVTQNQILRLSGKDIVAKPVNTNTLEGKANEAIRRSPPDMGTAAILLIKWSIFGGRFGALFANSENELLGVPRLSESQIEEIVKEYAHQDE